MIRNYEEHAYSANKRTEQIPADKAEIKQKQLHFVAVHHLAALVDASLPALCRIIVSDIERHSVGIALNYTGNDEQELPEHNEHLHKQTEKQIFCKALGKSAEQIVDLHLILASDK